MNDLTDDAERRRAVDAAIARGPADDPFVMILKTHREAEDIIAEILSMLPVETVH